jgi:transcriptional regulator with XRE-family HTH domain
MTEPEVMLRAGAKLKRIRVRLGLSVREVERRSLALSAERQNRDFSLSHAWINDVEKGRFVPGTFKIVSLGLIYRMTIAEIHTLYGIKPADITKERPLFRPLKTHLLVPADESISDHAELPPDSDVALQLENTNLLSKLVDIWGDVPVPLLRHLDLRRSLYGYIGAKDRTMSPLIPPGTFVQIDARQTRIQKGPAKKGSGQSPFARPIYFLDVRTGYAFGWCEIKDGILTLIPHPDSGEQTQTFRYPSEVEVVGRVTGIAMRIGEESQALLEEAIRRRNPPKK